MKFWHIIIFLGVIHLYSCSSSDSVDVNGVLARVGDEQLLLSDIEDSFPDFLNTEDSIARLKQTVTAWVKTQLMYEKAFKNIPDKKGELKRQFESYKRDLYIHKYEQLLLSQNLDTIITNAQIEEYYTKHKEEFVLRNAAVKPIFIVFPNTLDLSKAKMWFNSRKPEDLDKLQDFTFQFSPKFYFSDNWLELPQLLQEIPIKDIDVNKLFSAQGLILKDTINNYYVRIPEYVEKGKYSPQELVSSKIAKVLLHKRRTVLVKNIRNKIYQDALHKEQFEIF